MPDQRPESVRRHEQRLRALGREADKPGRHGAASRRPGDASDQPGRPAPQDGLNQADRRTPPRGLNPRSGPDQPGQGSQAGHPGRPAHRQHARPRPPRRRRHRLRIAAVIALSAVTLIVAAIGIDAWRLDHSIRRISVANLRKSASSSQNILMVGSTSRCVLKVQNASYGLCSEGVSGVNSDVIMILHLVPGGSHGPTASILSIPRDLFLPNARTTGPDKIDGALAQGPSQLVDLVEEDFGISIQHYVELNFDSFANVVNALGGISMYFPEPVYDQYSGLDIRTPGCHMLSGVEALQVVRARHLQYEPPSMHTDDISDWPYDPQSDLARIRRDHEFLRVLAAQVKKRGLSNPLTDQRLISALASQLQVDSHLSASSLVNDLLTYRAIDIAASPELTLPVAVLNDGSYSYDGTDMGDVEFPAQPEDFKAVDQFLGVPAGTNTMSGGRLPSPAQVKVSVLNGTGVSNQAETTASSLRTLGFDIAGTGNTPSVGTESETTVSYQAKSPSAEAAAEAVAEHLSGAVVLRAGTTFHGAEVTVTTGSDFTVDAPAHAKAKSTTTNSSTTSPTTAASSSSAAIGSPSAPVNKLEPWDPRACPAT